MYESRLGDVLKIIHKYVYHNKELVSYVPTFSVKLYSNLFYTSIQLKLQKRFLRFFINALKSDNSIISMLAKHLVTGSRSKSCQTLNYVCHCHGLDKFSLSESCISRIQDTSTESDILTAELVLDFLGLRSTVPDDPDITDVIEYFCTL